MYRVSYSGPHSPGNVDGTEEGRKSRELRRKLETLHQGATEGDLDLIWTNLDSADRSVAYAARVALETLPVNHWKSLLANEKSSGRLLSAALALARVGTPDHQREVFKLTEPFFTFEHDEADRERLLAIRVIQVSLARHRDASVSKDLRDKLSAYYNAGTEVELRREIGRVLLKLNMPLFPFLSTGLIEAAPSGEEQLFYVELLRNHASGWRLTEREKFFAWFLPGSQKPRGKDLQHFFADVNRKYVDGASFDGYLRDFRRQAIATLSAQERKQLEPLLSKPIAQAQLVPATPRDFVRDWEMEDLLPEMQKARQPNLERGRKAFVDAQCLQCHRFGNDGGVAGPELTGVGSKYSERDLLESIIEPSKVVSDQYQDHTVFLKDGEVFSGKLISESDKEVVLEIDRVAGTKEDFPRDNIEQLRPSQLSPMPTGLVNVLSLEEIFDLLAYLRTGVSTTR